MPVAFGFFQHALRVELQPDHEGGFGVVVGLNQPIRGVGHGYESWGKVADTLMYDDSDKKRLAAVALEFVDEIAADGRH